MYNKIINFKELFMIKLTYSFTNANGEKIDVYTLTNALGMEMDVMTGGGRILRLTAPDKNGYFGDVIFGYAKPEDYYTSNTLTTVRLSVVTATVSVEQNSPLTA